MPPILTWGEIQSRLVHISVDFGTCTQIRYFNTTYSSHPYHFCHSVELKKEKEKIAREKNQIYWTLSGTPCFQFNEKFRGLPYQWLRVRISINNIVCGTWLCPKKINQYMDWTKNSRLEFTNLY